MLPVLLLTLYQTLLTYYFSSKLGIDIKSGYLKIALAWFIGVYITTFLIFLLAIFFSFFTIHVLTEASFAVLISLEIFGTLPVFKTLKKFHLSAKNLYLNRKPFTTFNILVVGSCFLFSLFFFSPQLTMNNYDIYTSPIYWDFHWHAAVIQNFVYGDNFPPQNESYTGVPMTYHFFGDLVFGIYESLGLNLVTAINYGSIVAFFFALLAIIGSAEELFNTKIAGVIAAILAVLSGSGHFFYYLSIIQNENIFEIIGNTLSNTQHPWYASFIPGNPYHYAGIFFNLFYFLEERHMIFGIPYLLFCLFIFCKRQEFSKRTLLILGMIMGAFFYWEIYICITVFCALLFILIFDRKKIQTLFLLIGFMIVFTFCYAILKYVISNPIWFIPAQVQYPKVDFTFMTNDSDPSRSFAKYASDIVKNYAFAYGLRGVFFFISLYFIRKKNKELFFALLAFIIPTFILVNTVKLSPGVSENHKWIVPMNIIVDVIAAYSISNWFFEKKRFFIIFSGIICMFFLTVSGVIELTPFLNSQPTVYYGKNESDMIKAIRADSPPTASFVGDDERDIHLAGRKLFVGASAGPDYALNKDPREDIITQLYSSPDVHTFCKLTKTNNIGFVELNNSSQDYLFTTLQTLPFFSTVDKDNNPIIFVNAQKGCT